MSDEERNDLMAELTVIRRMIKGIGLTALGGIGLIVLVGVDDHYDQKQLRSDMDWAKPKVETLWSRYSKTVDHENPEP